MMNFKEYSVKKKRGPREIIISVLLYTLATVLGVVAMLFMLAIGLGQFAALLLFGFYYLAHIFSTNMNKEFEYAFTSDQITVDVIMNRSRRKRLIRFDLGDVEIIAPITDSSYASYSSNHFDKVIDATSRSEYASVYFAVISKEKQILLKFEPTHAALNDLYKIAPSKIKIEN